MLKKLVIKNVALIECAEIDFTEGLNVLSGETGLDCILRMLRREHRAVP